MGTGTSKRKINNTVSTSTQRKIQAIAALQSLKKSTSTEQTSHEDGTERGRYRLSYDGQGSVTMTDTSEAWEKLMRGEIPSEDSVKTYSMSYQDFNKVERKKSVKELEESNCDYFTIPYHAVEIIEHNETCFICGVYTGKETYTCRVCNNAYHLGCLQKIGHFNEEGCTTVLNTAKSSVGWSCHLCDNLSNLLTEDELQILMDLFDKLDINKDSSITEQAYLAYQKEWYQNTFERRMSQDEEDDEKHSFRRMDTDRSQTVSWWEFLNHEAVKFLRKREKTALLRLLTPTEIDIARRTFRRHDLDGDGEITRREAMQAEVSWYSYAYRNAGDSPSKKDIIEDHAKHSTNALMEADTDSDGFVTWQEYIRDRAIYLISSRPNTFTGALKRKGSAAKS